MSNMGSPFVTPNAKVVEGLITLATAAAARSNLASLIDPLTCHLNLRKFPAQRTREF